jgi:hypothetical protein
MFFFYEKMFHRKEVSCCTQIKENAILEGSLSNNIT